MTEPATATSEQLHRRPTSDGPNGGVHSVDVEAQDPKRTTGDGESVIEEEEEAKVASVGYVDILKQFSLLGWVAFGGPAAHIALFQKTLRWMTLPMYLEIFALYQCLPRPASTQVSFALGVMKKGLLGGLMSGILFQYPGAILMTGIGAFAAKKLENPQGWLKGIAAGVAAVGVALVASASKSMCRKLCATPLLATICTVTAVIAFYWPKPYTFPAVIVGSGLLTLAWSYYTKETPKKRAYCLLQEVDTSAGKHGFGMFGGAVLITTWITVLVVTLVTRRASKHPSLLIQWWEVFYRNGFHHLWRRPSGPPHALYRPCEARLHQRRLMPRRSRFLGDQHPILRGLGLATSPPRPFVQLLRLPGHHPRHQPRLLLPRRRGHRLAGLVPARHYAHLRRFALLDQV